jgi:hypothetical protein
MIKNMSWRTQATSNYYTNIIFQKTKRLSWKQNCGMLHNPKEYATGAAQV